MSFKHATSFPRLLVSPALILVPLLAGAALAPATGAQMPGMPVLQNAFSNPGITVAANYGDGSAGNAFAGAASWAPGAGRMMFSGGVGAYKPDAGKSQLGGGARLAFSLFSFHNGDLGTALFVGAGAAGRGGSAVYMLPIGVAVGYRRALGETRAFSVYGAPFYAYNRQKVGSVTTNASTFRASVGADVGLFSWLGATVGYEFGGNAKASDPGPQSGVLGIGLSVALRR
jgi:hypothetical protein